VPSEADLALPALVLPAILPAAAGPVMEVH